MGDESKEIYLKQHCDDINKYTYTYRKVFVINLIINYFRLFNLLIQILSIDLISLCYFSFY